MGKILVLKFKKFCYLTPNILLDNNIIWGKVIHEVTYQSLIHFNQINSKFTVRSPKIIHFKIKQASLNTITTLLVKGPSWSTRILF